MQTLIFSSQQPSKAKGFSLMELLIYLALAAVFIGGILTLTGKAGVDSDVRRAVQDLSDIDNAIRAFYGAQRLTVVPTAAAMEGVAAATLPHMGGATAGSIVTQDNAAIVITPLPMAVSATAYGWPHYTITYTGMETPSCAGILGALRGAVAIQVEVGVAGKGAWLIAPATSDDRVIAPAFAGGVEAHCEANDTATGIYTIQALYRI